MFWFRFLQLAVNKSDWFVLNATDRRFDRPPSDCVSETPHRLQPFFHGLFMTQTAELHPKDFGKARSGETGETRATVKHLSVTSLVRTLHDSPCSSFTFNASSLFCLLHHRTVPVQCVSVCVRQVMTAAQKGQVFLPLCIAKCASARQFPSRHC